MTTDAASVVDELLAAAAVADRVAIFAKSYCPFCRKVRNALLSCGTLPIVVDIDLRDDGNAIQLLLAERTGQKTVPSVFFGGNHIGGCNDTIKAIGQGLFSTVAQIVPSSDGSSFAVVPERSLADDSVSLQLFCGGQLLQKSIVHNDATPEFLLCSSMIDDSGAVFSSKLGLSLDFSGAASADRAKNSTLSLAAAVWKSGSCAGKTAGNGYMMAFVWDMVCKKRDHHFFVKQKVDRPTRIYLQLFMRVDTGLMLVGSVTMERWYVIPGVQRIPIRQSGLVGTLFIPPKSSGEEKKTGVFPTVLDLHGSMGGLTEYRSGLLASRGFMSFVVAFFNVASSNLPKKLEDVRLDYIGRAGRFLARHPLSIPGGIGILGSSTGGQVALAASVAFPDLIRAVVCVSGGTIHTGRHTMLLADSSDCSSAPQDLSELTFRERDGAMNTRGLWKHGVGPVRENPYDIALWKSHAAYFFVTGCLDKVSPSHEMANRAVGILAERGHPYPVYHCSAGGAGHLMYPHHIPFTDTLFHTAMQVVMEMGGRASQHAQSTLYAWKAALQFLRTQLKFPSARSSL